MFKHLDVGDPARARGMTWLRLRAVRALRDQSADASRHYRRAIQSWADADLVACNAHVTWTERAAS